MRGHRSNAKHYSHKNASRKKEPRPHRLCVTLVICKWTWRGFKIHWNNKKVIMISRIKAFSGILGAIIWFRKLQCIAETKRKRRRKKHYCIPYLQLCFFNSDYFQMEFRNSYQENGILRFQSGDSDHPPSNYISVYKFIFCKSKFVKYSSQSGEYIVHASLGYVSNDFEFRHRNALRLYRGLSGFVSGIVCHIVVIILVYFLSESSKFHHFWTGGILSAFHVVGM